ncbi:LysM and putative peptidoglycan-binding domain-containing protein 1 [Linum perenne]
MQMEREGGKEMMGFGTHRYTQFTNDYYDKQQNGDEDLGFDDYNRSFFNNANATTPSKHNGSGTSTNNSSPTSSPVSRARGFIEHQVSKFDTLAGVAIKYGVEVADIKKKNGLITDHQMFALKTLKIPLPGRHLPSPSLSNGSERTGGSSCELTPILRGHPDPLDSFQSLRPKSSSGRKVSTAMSSLQGFYGLSPGDRTQSLNLSPDSNPPLSHHRKSRSYVNVFQDLKDGRITDGADGDSMVRRRQKSEADFPNMLMREENSSNGGKVSAAGITGKGLALRPKAANRSGLLSDPDAAANASPKPATGDSDMVVDPIPAVRKSSSTSSLNDTDGSGGSFTWPTPKWSLKADLQAAISRPIFDGLPKPLSGWRNKAAVD